MNKLLSVSHVDLDGYTSQFFVKKHFERYYDQSENIMEYVNIDYGDLPEFFKNLDTTQYLHLFITDLNLDEETAILLNSKINDNFKIILIDHHLVKYDISQYSWYYLNKNRSATLSTFYSLFEDNKYLDLAEFTNAYDMWQQDSSYFATAAVMQEAMYSLPFVYQETKRNYIFSIFEFLADYELNYGDELIDLYPYQLEKDLLELAQTSFNVKNKKISSKNAIILSEFEVFKKIMDKSPTFFVGNELDIEVKATTMHSGNFQYLSHEYLAINPDVVLLNVNLDRGSASARSNNDKAVEVARYFHPKGGGHANAAGFKVEDDVANYLKDFILKVS